MQNIIGSLFSLIFYIVLVCMLLDFEVKNKKILYSIGLFVIVVLICNGLVLLNYGYATFMKLYPFLIYVPTFMAFMLISKYKGIKLIFVLLTVIVIYAVPIGIGLFILSFLGFNRSILSVICIILDIPTAFIVYKYLRPSFLYMMRNTDKGWLGFCAIPFSYFTIIYTIIHFTGSKNISNVLERSNIMIMLLTQILTLASYVMILRFFKQTREHLALQNEQNLLKTQVTAAQIHLEALEDSQEKTLIYRHDMRHHLSLINAYLTDNNIEAAKKYTTEVEKTINGAVVEKYCSNYAVNLILSAYIAKAKNEEITLETQIDLPEKTAVSDMDLCVIFANAIENAINACKNIPNPKDRTLKILCRTKNGKPYIKITNSYEGKVEFVNDMPVSTEEYHGLGTKSIVAVAQKYGGVYSFEGKNGVFQVSLIL